MDIFCIYYSCCWLFFSILVKMHKKFAITDEIGFKLAL